MVGSLPTSESSAISGQGSAPAAGPAYEGSGISCGMRARSGAIERIWIDGPEMNVRYEVIHNSNHNGRPSGVCGSDG